MASGQTQYYGLSQWEAVDKVEPVSYTHLDEGQRLGGPKGDQRIRQSDL